MKWGGMLLVCVVVVTSANCNKLRRQRKDAGAEGATAATASRGAPGTERGDCVPNTDGGVGTCEDGLLCLSNLCVRPPPADCKKVAEGLASMELGNYAAKDKRAPVVAGYRARCDEAKVSEEEGECLAAARTEWAAVKCVPRMFPDQKTGSSSDCKQVGEKVQAVLAKLTAQTNSPELAQMTDIAGRVLVESCTEDEWPKSLIDCILDSPLDEGAMEQCQSNAPPDLNQKIQARLAEAMQAITQ